MIASASFSLRILFFTCWREPSSYGEPRSSSSRTVIVKGKEWGQGEVSFLCGGGSSLPCETWPPSLAHCLTHVAAFSAFECKVAVSFDPPSNSYVGPCFPSRTQKDKRASTYMQAATSCNKHVSVSSRAMREQTEIKMLPSLETHTVSLKTHQMSGLICDSVVNVARVRLPTWVSRAVVIADMSVNEDEQLSLSTRRHGCSDMLPAHSERCMR